jgi:hypothetical protein
VRFIHQTQLSMKKKKSKTFKEELERPWQVAERLNKVK